VRALIGGVSYNQSQFNRAVDARRQTGSSWKSFVYLTAMQDGRTPDTMAVDEPITIDGWSPHNFEPEFLGPITLQTALQRSINTVAAKLADEVGRDNVAATARKLGITSPINTDPAMALGTTQVSPLEMAQAYAPFANGGFKADAYAIERIRTTDGKTLYEHPKTLRTRVIDEPALGEMTQMLKTVLVPPGTGVRAAFPGYDLAGKTGTTSDFKDAWFVGYTGGFVTAVWTGKDDDTPMRRITGGTAPADLWRAFMSAALPHLKVGPIPGGPVPPPQQDLIGDILANSTGASEGANTIDSTAPEGADGGQTPPAGTPPPG
jgi:penicillin-binding protein 1A